MDMLKPIYVYNLSEKLAPPLYYVDKYSLGHSSHSNIEFKIL